MTSAPRLAALLPTLAFGRASVVSSVMAARLPMRVRTRASLGKTVPVPLKAWASALGVICRALVALSLGAALATPAQAQSPAPTPLQPAPSQAAPSQAAPTAPPAAAPAAALTQVVTLPAGTGMLLRPHATRCHRPSLGRSAVARVQPTPPLTCSAWPAPQDAPRCWLQPGRAPRSCSATFPVRRAEDPASALPAAAARAADASSSRFLLSAAAPRPPPSPQRSRRRSRPPSPPR